MCFTVKRVMAIKGGNMPERLDYWILMSINRSIEALYEMFRKKENLLNASIGLKWYLHFLKYTHRYEKSVFSFTTDS